MDAFVFLIISWLGLTFLSIHRAHSGNDAKLEKKDLIWVVPTAVSGTLFTLDWAASHWSSISIPFPQGNATTSQYMTIQIPRLFPPLPSPIAWAFLGLIFVVPLAAVLGTAIYYRIRPPKSVVYETPQIIIEKADEPPERLIQIGRSEAERKQELEEIDRRRKDIYDAIKEWIQPPETRWQIGGQQEPLYLGKKTPQRAQKIYDCLKRNYPQIWIDLQEFRNKYAELMALETSIPDEFREKINGITNVSLPRWEARKMSIRDQLRAMPRQLIRQINLEIVEKHDTDLKC